MLDRAEKINRLFGQRLREIRERQNLSMHDLWLKSGITISQIGKIERGHGNPTLATIASLAIALQVTAEEFIPREIFTDDQ